MISLVNLVSRRNTANEICVSGYCPSVDYARGLVQVGERTYAFLQPDGGWGWSNAGLVVGDNEAVLIDTFFDLALTRELIDAVRTVTDLPIRKIVNTHH